MSREEAIEKVENLLNALKKFGTIAEKHNIYEPIKILLESYQLDESIIDKMSEKLTTPVNDKEWVKEYYRKEVQKEWKENLN